MGRFLALIYGAIAYAAALGTLLYAIGFITGLLVPKTLDGGPVVPAAQAIMIDMLLLSLFAVQHSVMARAWFRQWWTRFVPHAIERSTYVLCASLTLALLFWQWRPLPGTIWQIRDITLAMALTELALFGWGVAIASTFMINHFELFGLQQVVLNLRRREAGELRFRSPLLYQLVRHPLCLGLLIAFWATPVMTAGHLLFAAVTTGYIFLGIALEERDLIGIFGEEYRRYRERVGMPALYRRAAP